MKKTLVGGVALAALLLAGGLNNASAQSAYPKDWDRRIGDDPVTRFFNYYKLEWGKGEAPPDPHPLPPRKGWPTTPQTIPPMPFTEWPYGGATPLGVSRPNAVDSPLMVSIKHTALGKWMDDAHIQMYGWVNVGGNVSTNTVRPGGNWPVSYMYTPNTIQLDQAVLYIERVPDTVQKSHFDWGFRISGIYGENYRYTTTFGIASYQLLGHNLVNGFDFPMMYWEGYWPQIGEGLLVRVGRFISVPDIEAQLAPNNYMYSHSLTYTFDNYTNHGIQFTQALTKNWFFQYGVALGTDTAPWNYNKHISNPAPNAVYGPVMKRDPGNMPSLTLGVRWQSDSGYDNVYVVGDALNTGEWGYNNLQWMGATWYHKFNEKWHFSWEAYTLSQRHVLNASDPQGIIASGGYPFSAAASGGTFNYNAPNFAQCSNAAVVSCTARVFTTVNYLNYRHDALNNFSFRSEYYHDEEGQRTGTASRYTEFALGWQHWFSPQVVIRPEVGWYKSWNAPAFNGNCNQMNNGQPCVAFSKSEMWMAAMDLTVHF